jgi:hypothetical protein
MKPTAVCALEFEGNDTYLGVLLQPHAKSGGSVSFGHAAQCESIAKPLAAPEGQD